MRTWPVTIAATGLLIAAPVFAQDPAPDQQPPPAPVPPAAEQPVEPVQLEEDQAAVPPPDQAPPPTPPAAAAPAEPAAAAAPVAPPPAEPAPNLAGESRATTYGGPVGEKEWLFDFHGYFRAPMRLGIGDRSSPTGDQSGTTFHRPIIPDDQYLSWQYLGRGNDWAELFFSVGNQMVSGTVAVTGFQFTDAAWANSEAQFGVTLGYLTVTPNLPWKNVRAEAVVGSHWGRYGQAGKYDSGKYDTFVFGRTHVMGYKLHGEVDVGDVTLWAEQGFGTKRPNPLVFNNARFTLLNHLHAGLRYDIVKVGLHYLDSFTTEEARDGALPIGTTPPDDQPDGSLDVFGPEVRLELGPAGELYAAYSRMNATDAVTVAPAIEVLHSHGGGEFDLGVTANYLDGGDPATSSGGDGSVDTIAGQYEIHLNQLVPSIAPQDFTLFLFGMVHFVDSDDPDLDDDATSTGSSITKVKYGVDLVADLLPWFGAAFRYDRVQPNSEIPEQSFSTIYPRLLFRTDFITHELISLGYTRYFYNQRSCPAADPIRCVQPPSAPVAPEGFGSRSTGATPTQDANLRGQPGFSDAAGGFVPQLPDKGVVTLEASMWW